MSDTKLGHLFNSSFKIRPAMPHGALSVCLVQALCLSVFHLLLSSSSLSVYTHAHLSLTVFLVP